MKHWVIFLMILAVPIDGLTGQIRGSVETGSGVPVSGVTVEAWTQSQRIAAVLSDSTGTFLFPADVESRIVRLRASGLGFHRY